MQIDDNLELSEAGTVSCAHCGARVGDSASRPLQHALRHDRPASAAGAGVRANPALFTDRPIVLRQVFCPSCLTLLESEIVPGDERSYRSWLLSV
jgi:hypothetical protein